MTAQETNLLNAFETTISGALSSTGLTVTVNAVSNAAGDTLTAPCYLVIEPDSATQREYFLVSSIDTGTKTLTISAIGDRYLTGSAATSGLTHAAGSTVRMSAMAQHIEDINDRVDANFNEAGTEIVAGNAVKDEDTMVSDSAVHLATQQSIKAYVDSQVTAQDLDFAGDTGTGAVDLDSQSFTIAGTANEIETSALDQTITIGLPSTITTTLSGTSVLSDGVTATTQAASDNSTKVATTAYVDAQVTAEDLDVTADSGGPISIDLDTETLDIAGGTGITTSASIDTITIDIDSTVATLTGVQTLTNKTISGSSNTLSDIANASLTNSSITVSDSEAIPNTSAIDLGGTLTFAGTANEVTVLESAGTVTISLPTSITVDVSGDLTGTVTATSVLADGVTATTQAPGDNSTKVATTAYVDAVSVDDNLTVSDGTTSTTIDLDTQTFSILGTASQVTATTSAQTITLSLPATINVDTSGNAATATALETARTIAGQSFDGTANITIAAGDLSNVTTTGVTNGQVLTYNSTSGEFEPGSVGSATSLIDGDSDLTLTDGVNNGLDYDLDNTDMATWNTGGIALTTNGGIFRHHQTQAATYTVATNEGAVLAGPITITGTVTNNGTMVVI